MTHTCFPKPRTAGGLTGRLIALALLTGMGITGFADGPSQLTAGDLTQDGLSELVVMDGKGLGLVLLNQGNGQLIPAKKIYSQGTSTGPLTIADLTGDGRKDLVLLYPAEAGIEAVPGPNLDQNASLLLTGLGVDAQALAARTSPPSLAAVGLAGLPKIVVIQPDAMGTSLSVTGENPADASVRGLVWADIDGDQAEELIALLRGNGTVVNAYKGLPAQWNPIPLAALTDTQAEEIQAGKINADGFTDFLLWSPAADAVALLGGAGGTFQAQTIPLAESFKKKTVDINQDGLLDIAVLSPAQDTLALYVNQGNLVFQAVPVTGLTGQIQDMAFGNFVSPASLDLVVWTAQGEPATHLLSLYQFAGGAFTKIGETEIPDPGADNSIYQNVLIYKKSDITAGKFFPYRSFFVNDWTTGSSVIFADGSVKIEREILQDGFLVSAPPVTLTGLNFLPNPADFEAHVNQFSAEQSEFSFGLPVLPRAVPLTAAPPAGTYNGTIVVTPNAPAGAAIYYRQNGGGWQTYTPGTTEIILYQNAIVDFYATLGGNVSSMLTMNYTLEQDPSADSDNDGIPDALEGGFGLPIFSSNKDYDGDGWDDLDELVRQSDPKDKTSVPADADQDGWSDFDEGIRQTNANDPLSFPKAPGTTSGEYLLTANSSIKLTKDDQTDNISDGSFLGVWNLTNSQIASATLTAAQWTLRLPGPEPLILRAREKSANTLTVSLYSPSYIPCLDPAGLYDGGQSGADWLNLVRQQATQQVLTSRNASYTPPAVAATLAFELWLVQHGRLPGPLVWGAGFQALTQEELNALRLEYDLDAVYGYLLASLPEAHAWTGMVSQVLEWSRSNPPAQDVDLTLQQLAMGIPVDPSLLPPSLTPDAINQAVADLGTVLANAPSKRVELTGTLITENGKTLLDTGSEKWPLNFGGANIVTGSQITIRGIRETACSTGSDVIVRVTETVAYQPTLALNNTDSDGDGLPDQWEAFYFGRTDAKPHEDPDGDGADNRTEFLAYTHPLNNASKPTESPNPTPTPVITPPTATPTATPTLPPAATPTPTSTPTVPAGGFPKSAPVAQYAFSEADLAAAGFAEIPGGFMSFPAGESSLGVIPPSPGSSASDGHGLRIICDPGEVQMIQSLPVTNVGSNPVLIRCVAQATTGGGQFALAAIDGSFDGSASALIPHDTQYMANAYKRVAMIYDPTSSDTISVILQLYNPATSTDPVTVYVDNLEIIPLLPGTAIEPNDILINGGDVNPAPLPVLPKPAPVHVYNFAQGTVEAAGFAQVPGGFLAGSTPGLSVISGVPFGWASPSADGRGVLFTCNPGEIQLIMASPALGVGQQPTLIRMTARADSGEGSFALAALDGSLDGSIVYDIPASTAYMTGGFTQVSMLYEPTKTDSAVVVLQLAVPATASGPVSVYVDQIEVIPFVPGTLLEASDLATRPQ